jgi:HlyD family secretion protein
MVTEQPKPKSRNLFRKEALEQTASPERLDQLVQIVSPKRWLSLIALGTLVAAGTAWAFLGRIPITVTGKGVLIYPGQVLTVQSASSGRVLTVNVQVGDRVRRGQVLATIDQSETAKQLELAREKLVQLQQQDQTARSAQTQRNSSEQEAIARQRQALLQNLQTVQALTPVLREKGVESIQRDRQALEQRLQNLRDLLPVYEQRWRLREEMSVEGAVSRDMVLQAQQEYLDIQSQFNQAESQLKQLDVKEADAQRQYLDNLNQINELQAQLQELDSRAATQAEQDLTSSTNRSKEIQETERAIAQLELQLQESSQIVSEFDGQVVELSAKPGELLQPGLGVATIAPQESGEVSQACSTAGADLTSVVFLPVNDGKQVEPGMTVQVTPSIVKREEYGGIVGQVTEVSAFPITQQGAASLIGNADVLPEVMGEGAYLAVFAELECDSTVSGYRWSSSQGPEQSMTQGMTTTVRLTVEERTPISYVLPILKSWTGWN